MNLGYSNGPHYVLAATLKSGLGLAYTAQSTGTECRPVWLSMSRLLPTSLQSYQTSKRIHEEGDEEEGWRVDDLREHRATSLRLKCSGDL